MRQLPIASLVDYLGQLAIASIVVTLVLSGPVVPQIDFTPRISTPAAGSQLGEGRLNISAISMSSTPGSLTSTQADSTAYELTAPDTRLTIQTVSGDPLLLYRLVVPDLELTETTVYHPGRHGTGPMTLSLQANTTVPVAVQNATYPGTLTVIAYTNGTKDPIAHTPITVVVNK